VGFGIHADIVIYNTPTRLTQAELEQHPHFKHFGDENQLKQLAHLTSQTLTAICHLHNNEMLDHKE
jgi:hypothetical protein